MRLALHVRLLLVLLGAPAAALAAQAGGEAGYTDAQAERGRRLYGAFCATCHGVELEGAVGPIGRQYVATTSGRSGFYFGTWGSPTVFVFALPKEGR